MCIVDCLFQLNDCVVIIIYSNLIKTRRSRNFEAKSKNSISHIFAVDIYV